MRFSPVVLRPQMALLYRPLMMMLIDVNGGLAERCLSGEN
jgi:hypothetical protein